MSAVTKIPSMRNARASFAAAPNSNPIHAPKLARPALYKLGRAEYSPITAPAKGPTISEIKRHSDWDYLGSRMKGGSILVLRPVGESVGLGMRRGTIVLGQRPGEVPRLQHQATSAMKPDEHES